MLVDGEPRPVVGTVSMDVFAVELGSERAAGTPVTIVGPGVPLEAHARVAGTITYELASRLATGPTRARRVLVDPDRSAPSRAEPGARPGEGRREERL